VEYGSLNLRLGVVLASWQARTGYGGEAQRILGEVAGSGELAMTRAALEADVSNRAVRNAVDGIAETYLAMGATLRQQNATETAQILLQLSLSMRPDLTAARLLLADVLETAKRPAAALEALRPVTASDPLVAVVQLRRAMIEDVLGQTAEATALLEDLARTYSDRPEPLAQAGDMLRRKSRFAEAVTVYDRAVARLGTPSRANWPLFYERGVAYERSGDWTRAESDFQYALKLAPDQPSILNYLGYAWVERNQNLDQARQMIQRAVDQQPNDGAFVDSLGWVLLRRGDAAGALKNLQHAVELQSEDPVINGHLGDALAANGRWREAEFQWRRALTLKPDANDEKRIVAKLDSLPKPGATRVAEPARPGR
jgi:Flp pilus assembly protein TadD